MANRIEDYALIGDCETAALIDREGSIDWLCWPRFDSDACLARLLGTEENGRWRIAPTAAFQVSRRYRPDTLILETEFTTAKGRARLIDFMPPRGKNSDIVRIVEGLEGEVEFCLELILRFGYGRTVPWVSRLEDGRLRAVAGPEQVVLDSPVELRGERLTTVADFTVRPGDRLPFILTQEASHLPAPERIDPEHSLSQTEGFWRDWMGACQVEGPYAEPVRRSLMTLKALTYAPTGGVVAAPTTSVPEAIGGVRNWDYRFCWIRDSTLTLLALMNSGYYDEAGAWRDWLLRAVAGSPADMQIMYGLAGERRLDEWTVDWLAGFEGSKPVRVGNDAHGQFQLDVYGELMDSFHQARVGGLSGGEDLWDLQRRLIDHVAQVWATPDEGIWEVRGPRKKFTYSRVMAWVAVDRAIKSAELFELEAPLDAWRGLREAIAADVWAGGFDKDRNSFTRAYGEPDLDASLLLLAQVGFVEPSDPRYRGTVEAIERELMSGGFVLRYRTDKANDGLPAGEGAFLACSFWLADAYALIGRHDDAVALFERLLALSNDVGLLAEEYDASAGRFTGNFPQAFSHVGLINTAANLTHVQKPNEQRKNS